MNPKRPCPVCSAISVDILHSQRFVLPEGHPLTPGYNIVACLLCEFAYADTPLTQLDYDRYYTQLSSYSDGKTSTEGVENPADMKRQQKTARHRPEHLWQVPLLIETIAPDKYSYHIRSHALNDFDLVLYAIPKEPV